MKLKDKIKSYSFWVSIASAVILILKVLGNRCGFTVDESMISDIFTALCSVLVLLGIIVIPQSPNQTNSTKQDINQQLEETMNENNDTTNTNNNDVSSIINIEEPVLKCKEDNDTIIEDNTKYSTNDNTDSEIKIIDNLQEIVIAKQNENSENIENLTTESIDNFNLTGTNDINLIQECNQDNFEEQLNNEKNSNNDNLKSTLNYLRENFSSDIDKYIFELEEELRKIKESR